jgi:hypothetical protein
LPSTRVETTAGWINGRHAELIAAVQRALIEEHRIYPQALAMLARGAVRLPG